MENNIDFIVKKIDLSGFNIDDNPEDINFVIYSHSSFIDMLKIQIDYLRSKGNLILIINQNTDERMNVIYPEFTKVLFYEDTQPYGYRLYITLSQMDLEYFIFVHDADIIIDIDIDYIKKLVKYSKLNNVDRIDFQLAYDFNNLKSNTILDDDVYLIKSSNTDTYNQGYPYNVNPSLWKRESLLSIVDKFWHRDYRSIEKTDVQRYAIQFNIFKLYSKIQYRCAFSICLYFFKYLHLTRMQKIIKLEPIQNVSYDDIVDEYHKIVDKYNLKSSSLW